MKRPTDCPKQRGRKIPCTLTQCRYYERHAKLSCALWEAENGEHKLEEIGDILGLSRQRIEQIQRQALAKLLTIAKRHGMTVDQLPAPGRCVWDSIEMENPLGRYDLERTKAMREAAKIRREDRRRVRLLAYGNRLRSARLHAGVSQRGLARELGYTPQRVANIEAGWKEITAEARAAYERLGAFVSAATLETCA